MRRASSSVAGGQRGPSAKSRQAVTRAAWGAARTLAARVEPLEPRRLLAADLSGGILTVTGTTVGDVIEIERDGGDYEVTLNGDDQGTFDRNDVDAIRIFGLDGDDLIELDSGVQASLLDGGDGHDTLTGSGGNDTLRGGAGNDSLAGGGGDDLLDGGAGGDAIVGSAGRDTVDYSARSANLVVNFGDGANDGAAGEGDDVRDDVENFTGGSGNDSVKGSDSDNVLDGRGGSDTLIGMPGNDTLIGGDGDDHLDGKEGADLYQGGAGGDSADYRFETANLILSIDGVANEAGGNATGDNLLLDMERIVGGTGNDRMTGSDGADSFSPGAGNDTVLGGLGDDFIDGDLGDDSLLGEGGNDVLAGQGGSDTLSGGTGNDAFVTNDGIPDTLDGGAGSDNAVADAGLDTFANIESGVPLPEPEVTVTVGGNNLPDGTGNVGFGTVTQGAGAPTRTFTVRNDGDGPLVVGAVTVPAGFTVIDPLVGPIAAGASESFTVRLDAAAPGTFGGTVSFTTSDADESPFNFAVAGTVVAPVPVAPEVTVLVGGTPVADGTASFDFGSTTQGAAGPTRTFTVRNDGDDVLVVGAVGVPAGFTVIDALVGPIAPGASESFTVRLDTAVSGTFGGQVSFANTDADENPYNFAVSGTVVSPPPQLPEITVLVNGNPIADGAGAFNFGSVLQGATGPTRTFTVRNDGTGTLTLGAINLPAGFTLIDGLPTSLAAGASDSFTVRLDTGAAAVRSGTITVVNNDTDEDPFDVAIGGTVVAPTPPASPEVTVTQARPAGPIDDGNSTVEFGNGVAGTRGATRTFRVRNDGDAVLTLGAVTAPAGFTIIDPLPAQLAPGQAESFVVQVDTSAPGRKDGFVSFATNDASEGTFTFRLIANVGVTAVELPEATINSVQARGNLRGVVDGVSAFSYGTVAPGARAPSRTFRVANNGNANLALGRVVVPTGFVVTDDLPGVLAPGATDVLVIAMATGGALGSRGGTVSIATNDSDENPYTWTVSGTLAQPQAPAGAPEVTVRLTDGTNIADGATVPVSFGAVAFAGKAPTRTFRISNTGTAPLTLGAINVPAGFALMSGTGVSALAPGATASFTLGLRTDGGGVKSGRVTFATNDANENPFDFAVGGSVSAVQTPTTAVTGSVSASGTLSVNGTPGIDTIAFATSSRGLSVVGNGVAVNGSPFNGVRRIVVNGFDGADRIDASGLAIPVTIFGGGGNDTLIGGHGPDSLSGGIGNDVLTGGPGLDVLRGDDGDDLLNAQDGLADSLVDGGAGNDTVRKDRTDSGSGT